MNKRVNEIFAYIIYLWLSSLSCKRCWFSMYFVLDTVLGLRNTETIGANFSFIYSSSWCIREICKQNIKMHCKASQIREQRGEEKETISEGFYDSFIKKVTLKQNLDWWVGVYPNIETGEKDSMWGLHRQRLKCERTQHDGRMGKCLVLLNWRYKVEEGVLENMTCCAPAQLWALSCKHERALANGGMRQSKDDYSDMGLLKMWFQTSNSSLI